MANIIKKYLLDSKTVNKKTLKELIYCAFLNYGKYKATSLVDGFKNLGFYFATRSGISISIEDLKVPDQKKYALKRAKNQVLKTDLLAVRGEISEVERFQKVIDTWQLTNEIVKDNVVAYFKNHDPLNPIYIMAFSGARGNLSQVRQLVGMRGLMADPNGQIIDLSINHNFREGLTLTDYIISSYGARKGIIDTALKTADSGYLTRRLVDVAQHIIIREIDCKTKLGLRINNISTIKYGLVGRTLAKNVVYLPLKKLLAKTNTGITDRLIDQFKKYYITSLKIRSPLTCESSRSICQKCYGWNLSKANLVSLGESVGVIAAQSIGEPGTQLTMRTFHTGGVATNDTNRQIISNQTGQVFFSSNLIVQPSRTMYGEKIYIVENSSRLYLLNKNLVLQKIDLVPGLILFVTNKAMVHKNQKLAEFPVLTNQAIIATKKIQNSKAGEIFFQKLGFNINKNQKLQIKNSGLIWVMDGTCFSLKTNSLLKIKSNRQFLGKEIMSQTKTVSNQNGIFKIKKNTALNKEKYQTCRILNPCAMLDRTCIFEQEKNKKQILLTKTNKIFELNLTTKNCLLKSKTLAKLKSNKYSVFIGSQIFYSRLVKKESGVNQINGEKILLLPEQHYIITNQTKFARLSQYEFVSAGQELIRDEFISQNGIVILKKREGVLNKIIFQPGEQLLLHPRGLRVCWQLHAKILYPGEIILNQHVISKLTYAQIHKQPNNNFKQKMVTMLLNRPITELHIPKPVNQYKLSSTFIPRPNVYKLTSKTILLGKNGTWINGQLKKKVSLLQQKLQIQKKSYSHLPYKIGVVQSKKFDYIFTLVVIHVKTKYLTNTANNLVNSNTIKNQILEPYTILHYYNSTYNHNLKIQGFKNQRKNPEQLFFTTPYNYRTFTLDPNYKLLKQKRFITKKDYLTKSNLINSAGYIINVKNNKMRIRLGQPYFISKGSILYVNNGDYVEKNFEIGLLIYERIISGDIVQGLPRIEQILEARVSADSCGIVEKFGIMITRAKGEWFNILEKINKRKYNSFYLENKKVNLKIGELVKLGQPYNMGGINPKELLQLYFEHYYSMYGLYDATMRALIQVQFLLVNSIQTVYRSQGIEISSKHIELIVKQMTSKVTITIEKNRLTKRYDNYENMFLFQKMFELQHLNYINKALTRTHKPILLYEPTLLGVTKVSLLTESFLSASSFQGTRTIMMQAAIEGKMDWLRGLKENVILGNLLPAGTGFHNLTLTSNTKVKM